MFLLWNRRWKAPLGPQFANRIPMERRFNFLLANLLGPFAFQPNNSTRVIEYPWAFHYVPIKPGMSVLEIGGALSGFQFAVARKGASVTNVDPFVDYGDPEGYAAGPECLHSRLNCFFRTKVRLVRATLPEAAFREESFDVAYGLSVLEHFREDSIETTLTEVRRVLRPGGLFIVTVDLFLDLIPFTRKISNQWGRNISIRWLVERSQMELVYGHKAELHGFEEFDPNRILTDLAQFHIGESYPSLSQMFVLKRAVGQASRSFA